MFLNKWIDRIGDWNPQLFRELKGRLTPKSLGLMALVSGLVQSMVYFSFVTSLPYQSQKTNHYCKGTAPAGWNTDDYLYNSTQWCHRDALDQITTLNWPLWWTEIFVTIAIIGFLGLLISGTYVLIQDLSKEQRQGTLNFVTLTPQSALAIALGKILGVPTFVYGVIAFALPLHLLAGLKGGIPFPLIVMFYGVTAGCCLFTFSAALLYGLIGKGGGAVKAWSASGGLFYFTSMSSMFILHESIHAANVMDVFLLLNPLHLMHYLVQASPAIADLDWFQYDSVSEVTFYGVHLWQSVVGATLAHLTLYGVGSYWFAQAFKRKFHNGTGTVLSKMQSYCLTASVITLCLGFTVQTPYAYFANENNWLLNFAMLAIAGVFYILLLVIALSPSFQSLQDWSRYHSKYSLKDWLFGERSPANGAIAVNVVLGTVPMMAVGWMVADPTYKLSFTLGLMMQGLMAMLLATVAIFVLTMRHKKRGLVASVVVASCILLPLISLMIANANPEFTPAPWLWTISPVAVSQFVGWGSLMGHTLGQIVAIALLHRMVQYRVQQIGQSELKQLMREGSKATA